MLTTNVTHSYNTCRVRCLPRQCLPPNKAVKSSEDSPFLPPLDFGSADFIAPSARVLMYRLLAVSLLIPMESCTKIRALSPLDRTSPLFLPLFFPLPNQDPQIFFLSNIGLTFVSLSLFFRFFSLGSHIECTVPPVHLLFLQFCLGLAVPVPSAASLPFCLRLFFLAGLNLTLTSSLRPFFATRTI